jgi:hypothetical protein
VLEGGLDAPPGEKQLKASNASSYLAWLSLEQGRSRAIGRNGGQTVLLEEEGDGVAESLHFFRRDFPKFEFFVNLNILTL